MTIKRPAARDCGQCYRADRFIALGAAEDFPLSRILIILVSFGSPSGGLIDIPISFLLKNKLKLSAHEVAGFRLVAAVPLYLSFGFGFIRDMWNPFGMGDRGFMLLFAPSARCSISFSLSRLSPMRF